MIKCFRVTCICVCTYIFMISVNGGFNREVMDKMSALLGWVFVWFDMQLSLFYESKWLPKHVPSHVKDAFFFYWDILDFPPEAGVIALHVFELTGRRLSECSTNMRSWQKHRRFLEIKLLLPLVKHGSLNSQNFDLSCSWHHWTPLSRARISSSQRHSHAEVLHLFSSYRTHWPHSIIQLLWATNKNIFQPQLGIFLYKAPI